MKNKLLTLKQILIVLTGLCFIAIGLMELQFKGVGLGVALLVWSEIIGIRKDIRNAAQEKVKNS